MLKKIKSFFLTAILGGITVILPIAIIVMVIIWLVEKIAGLISPMTIYLTSNSNMQGFMANFIVIGLLLFLCFFVGLFERTKLGHFFVEFVDKYLLKKLPGYSLVKDTVVQFIGNNQAPFTQVALVKIFGSDARCTAFVTDTFEGGYTVFIPTGPNPTSGNICHLPKDAVELIDTPAEEAMKSIIGCGVGSKNFIQSK